MIAPRRRLSSVDPIEVSHFDALAATWWDLQGPSRLLHEMNALRHDFIRACLETGTGGAVKQVYQQDDQRLHYLDLGCGGGIFTESAARLASTASVTGADPSAAVVAVAQAHAASDPLLTPPRLTYVQAAAEQLAGQYDVVTLFEVLEHVAAPAVVLDCCARLVRPGGWLVASTIARTIPSWIVTKLMAERVLGLVPPGTHDWARYIDEAELRAYLLQAGGLWEAPRCQGVMYLPGLGWTVVPGSQRWGNYFFAVRRTGLEAEVSRLDADPHLQQGPS